MAVLVEIKEDDPIKDGTGPFAIRQKAFGICSQRLEQSRNVWVTPTDQNHFSLLVSTQVSHQVSRLLVAKTRIDLQTSCLRKWFHRKTRPMTLLRVLSSKDSFGFPTLGIRGEI